MHSILFLGVLSLSLPASPAVADANWPVFRGGQAAGVAEDPNLPVTWSTTKNVAWKTEIPGTGWSSPIIWGDKIFLTSVIQEGQGKLPKKGLYFGGEQMKPPPDVHRWMVYCIDARTGKILWESLAHKGVPSSTHHIKNTYASETPVTDGERVYAYFGNLGLFCYDLDGKPQWSQHWDSNPTAYGWGTASSPIVYKDRLYIVNDNDKHSFLVALDKFTGKDVWRVERDEKSNWATPFIWENDKRTEIITCGRKKVRSYDLNGKLLWELGGMSSITIPTPLAKGGLLYICSGYVGDKRRPIFAIRPGAAGDISLKENENSNEWIVWCRKQAGPYNPSPIAYGDYLYVLYDRGLFSCYDLRTGKEVYAKERMGPGATAFTTSPWAYGGKVFCLSEDGDTFVIKAGPKYELLGKNSLEEMCMATPAIAHGSLFIRTLTKLYRIEQLKAE
ncbi:MAG TPA: PQQ-binding-like beta-propeller repeat protein [Gemmataceae bacterium]|nr:PQQ-binding-like beta-propeller repeat protein [Gemmataceae bacterium]